MNNVMGTLRKLVQFWNPHYLGLHNGHREEVSWLCVLFSLETILYYSKHAHHAHIRMCLEKGTVPNL